MTEIFPDYYKDFRCIGGACRHNCCIGWEIDIDPASKAFYDTVGGELGRRLREGISNQPTAHFILGEGERCPFLNSDGLCDIIIELGKEHICDICTAHPRFRNELPGRVETGLGLCCEEAARIILGKRTPAVLEMSQVPDTEDEIIALRDRIITLLQNRTQSIPLRINNMLCACGASLPERTAEQWAQRLLSLERLDEEWTCLLTTLIQNGAQADIDGFDAHMSDRQTEYEQLLVYFIYRHFANAADMTDAASRAAFAALGCLFVHALGAVIYTLDGDFTFEQQVELARLFSSEIEYSDENLCDLLDELSLYCG